MKALCRKPSLSQQLLGEGQGPWAFAGADQPLPVDPCPRGDVGSSRARQLPPPPKKELGALASDLPGIEEP